MQNENILANTSNFVVKESIVLDFFIAAFLFCIALSAVAYDSSYLIAIPSGGFAIVFLLKGLMNKTSMKVNKEGIYIHNSFITNWQLFKAAYARELPGRAGSTADNFFLIIEHYKIGQTGFFEYEMPLTDTQDKSQEEILAAINYYYALSQKA